MIWRLFTSHCAFDNVDHPLPVKPATDEFGHSEAAMLHCKRRFRNHSLSCYIFMEKKICNSWCSSVAI